MKKMYLHEVEITHINKASVVITFEFKVYFITKRLMNQLLHDKQLDFIIIENSYNGRDISWIAVPSIF